MQGFWCKKIGMTQVFESNGALIPVTVFEAGFWIITQIKRVATDGYSAVQVGLIRPRFQDKQFHGDWLTEPDLYFALRREIPCAPAVVEAAVIGAPLDLSSIVKLGDTVTISGVTIGRGFQGGVKRHGFSGGRGSHGCKLGRGPGSLSFMRSRGRVIKNRRMAGHMGVEACTVHGLRVVAMQEDAGRPVVLVKGSVPGKTGSLLYVHKM